MSEFNRPETLQNRKPTDGSLRAFLERLWVLNLDDRDGLDLFWRQDAELDRARPSHRPAQTSMANCERESARRHQQARWKWEPHTQTSV